MGAPLCIDLQVRYVECDMQGHVFNGHYLTWFDMAHTALLDAALDRPYVEWSRGGIDLVVAESGVRHLAPAHFGDRLTVAVWLDPLATTSMTSRYRVTRSGETVATGFLRHVCVTAPEMRKRPWPEELRAGFARFVMEAVA